MDVLRAVGASFSWCVNLHSHCATLFRFFFFFQAEDGIRDDLVTGVQTCALPIYYAGRDKDDDEAYRQAITVMGTGPRAADAYGRFLLRHNRGEDAKTLYERALKENPGNPVAERALRDIAAKKTLPPLIGSPTDGVPEAVFGISASLNDSR